FSAWGVGGFILPRVSQMISSATGSFHYAYLTAGVLLVLGAGMTMVINKPSLEDVPEAATETARRPRVPLGASIVIPPMGASRSTEAGMDQAPMAK
ncbi:MAG: hypothetical protein KQJ78_08900, partial [Deltaproteobacteria bacterium]|nr:hypothetical protein [Deltaproteobacteria bacterium]